MADDDDEALCEELRQRHHMRLRTAFVAAARRQLRPSEACTAERLHTIALHTDWAACAVGGALSDGALATTLLRGSHVLQIDELADVANNREDRGKLTDLPSRVLRLRLTDGVASVAAIENKRIGQLSVRTPVGAKLLVTDVPVSRRILLLSPDNCRLLGGSVQALVDAHTALRTADAVIGTVGGGIVPPSLRNAPLAAAPPPLPPLLARPPLVSAVPPPLQPLQPLQPAVAAIADGPADDNTVPGFIDEDLDLSAFLAAEESAFGARKEVIDLAGRSFDADFDDVDDLVRIVSQVPDWDSDDGGGEDEGGDDGDGSDDGKQQKRPRRLSHSSSSSSDKIHATPPASDSDFEDVIVSNQAASSSTTKPSSAVTAISLIDLCDDE